MFNYFTVQILTFAPHYWAFCRRDAENYFYKKRKNDNQRFIIEGRVEKQF